MSSDWEHTIAGDITLSDPPYVKAYRSGWSGNSRAPQPDVFIHDNSDGMGYALELKGPLQKDTASIEEADLQQLKDCRSHMTRVWLVIRFSNRSPLVVPWVDTDFGKEDERPELETVAEEFEYIIDSMAPQFNPRVHTSDKTGITRLYFDKPELDNDAEDGWPSAQHGKDDYREILRGVGIYRPGNEE